MRISSISVILGLCLAGAAMGQEGWQQLAAEGASAGLDAEQFQELIGQCRRANLSLEATRTVAEGLFRAGKQQLPTECLYAKIDEGLAKGASAERITQATGIRVQMLERADALVKTHRPGDLRGRPGLIVAGALALESGVADTGVARLLADPNAHRPGWLMAAIEGLETLHAQEFPAKDAERLMVDALAQGLRRYELMQAVDLALRKQREGIDPADITLEVTASQQKHGGGRQP